MAGEAGGVGTRGGGKEGWVGVSDGSWGGGLYSLLSLAAMFRKQRTHTEVVNVCSMANLCFFPAY